MVKQGAKANKKKNPVKKQPANLAPTVLTLGKIKLSSLENYEKSAEYAAFFKQRQHEFETAMHNITLAKKEQTSCYYGEDSILVFKWNNAGLLVRAPTAAAHGWVNDLGAPVATAEDMKEAIVQRLTQAPNGGTNLGDHHDLFQFLPSFKKYQCVGPLIQGNLFLRHHGLGWTFATPAAQAAASTWPDIVDYVQEVTIVKSNAAVGPVDVPFYFNC